MSFNISILGSTRGSNLEGVHEGLLNSTVKIVSVISNKSNAGILDKAKKLHLPTIYIEQTHFEKNLDQHLKNNKTDLLVLMGFMKILSTGFVSAWKNKIINVHPSLLPKHAGLMNLAVHQAVLDQAERESGCTVHFVIDKVDAGKIIIQKSCSVFANDTAESLKERVQKLEVDALVESIQILSA